MTTSSALPPPDRPRHSLAVGALMALVMAGHAWLLSGTPEPSRLALDARAGGAVAMQVRQVKANLPAAPQTDAATPAVKPATAAESPKRVNAGLQSPLGGGTASASLAAASAEAGGFAAAAPAAPEPMPDTPAALAMAAGEATPVPVYATRLPPPFVAQYAVQRPQVHNLAELTWQPDGSTYRLRLSGQLATPGGAAWSSQGALDAHGIAPERYAESRRGREQRAANFQRQAERITFSGPAVEYPLVPGAQDRLSWLLQIGAVLNANPALAEPGAEISLFVVGTRGDARTWVFKVLGQEHPADVPGPVTAAIHLRREPQAMYDTEAEVWLDPARHHVPLRVQLRVRPAGEGTVYRLQTLQTFQMPPATAPP